MQTNFAANRPLPYDGTQLAPHWIFREFGLTGNAVVAFVGEAKVSIDHMVDLEDVKNNAPIYSPKMLHFLGEWFIDSLTEGILIQNLFVRNVYEALWEAGARDLSRKGNDLFYQGRKLSVSIATRSPVSVLFHFGINIETEGTPIPTAGLKEMAISEAKFAPIILERFQTDWSSWQKARCKVSAR